MKIIIGKEKRMIFLLLISLIAFACSDSAKTEGDSGDLIDADSDGIPDNLDADSDGISDNIDADGDGIPDSKDLDIDTGDGVVNIPDECASISEGAQNTRQPADIIFVIDNSKSLFDEIEMVRKKINDFAAQIENSGIDPRIVMISCLPGQCSTTSGGGSVSYGICIDPPLGAADGCQLVNPDDTDPEAALTNDSNPDKYEHVIIRVPSMKGLEWLLTTYSTPNDLTDNGWGDNLRDNAVKHVVLISDDGDETTAAEFDKAFKALDPKLENYQFHGIFAYTAKDLAPDGDQCSIYAAPSSPDAVPSIFWDTYPQLVSMTGGVSGDLCMQDFDPTLDAISSSVITSSKINCEWPIPDAPGDKDMDPELVNVEFQASADASAYFIGRVESEDLCSKVKQAWYYDDPANPTTIIACPQTCTWIQSIPTATLNIAFGCETESAPIILD
ncbi:MAG: hypothetical protein JXR91_15800 [Deltaproteobacteria bacterium]|nr:hypothetical protein [Deltaproteobacteria bacterium]